jgi:hypothetical protein
MKRSTFRSQKNWEEVFHSLKAYWIHDGDTRRPHIELATELHTDGYFDSRIIMPETELLSEAAADLAMSFENESALTPKVKAVVAVDNTSERLLTLLAQKIGLHNKRECFYAIPTKRKIAGTEYLDFSDEAQVKLAHRPVLICQDSLISGERLKALTTMLTDIEAEILPYVLVLANFTGEDEIQGKKIIALVDQPINLWQKGECTLCWQKSLAITKVKENWDLLNAQFPPTR